MRPRAHVDQRKSRILAAAVTLLTVLLVLGPSSFVVPSAASEFSTDVRADLDGDGVFDDLERAFGDRDRAARLPVIVSLREAASVDALAAVRRAVGDFPVSRRFKIVDAFAAAMSEQQVRAAAGLPVVLQIERNARVYAFNDGAQDGFGVTRARLDAPALDGDRDGDPAAYSPDDLVAAVIDTGVDAAHKDLDEGKVLAFKDFVKDEAAAYDDNGHGTHVAATLAGEGDAREDRRYRGVAPGAGIVAVKVLEAGGSGALADVIAGVEWVVANKATYGIEAMNLSLGVPGCTGGSSALSAAVNNASAAGILPVVSAGNSGPTACSVGDPGSAEDALTVANMYDPSEGGYTLAHSSSRGPTADGRLKPDIAAPGSEITSAAANTPDGYKTLSGTSMSSPFVAGVALLVLEENPSLTPAEVKQVLMQTAVDWGRGAGGAPSSLPGVNVFSDFGFVMADPGSRAVGAAGSTGRDIDYGAGRLDAYRALEAAGAPLADAPAAPGHELLEGELASDEDVDSFEVEVPDGRLPLAMTLIVAEGQSNLREQTAFSSGSVFLPESPTLVVRDPAGAPVAGQQRSGRQITVSDTSVLPGDYTVEVRPPALQIPEQVRSPLRYFIDVSYSARPEPPETVITAGPLGTIASASVSFEFEGLADEASFDCALDGGAWQPCTSPTSYSGLADGRHSFSVRARDAGGNVDPTPATRDFTVDTTPPDSKITAGPAGLLASSSASFEFEATEAGAEFECAIDFGPFEPCVSPHGYSELAEGDHTFWVRARDAVANVDPTPASREFTVDTTPPETTITAGPEGIVGSRSASFDFEALDGGIGFECMLDAAAWEECTSPMDYGELADGEHRFSVRALDAAGNVDPTPASRAFTVDTSSPTSAQEPPSGEEESPEPPGSGSAEEQGAGPAPEQHEPESPRAVEGGQPPLSAPDVTRENDTPLLDVRAPRTRLSRVPRRRTRDRTPTFRFSADERGVSYRCRVDKRRFRLCASPRTLRRLRYGRHRFEVVAIDSAGNADPSPARFKFRVVRGRPAR